jgi:hypothetical protein
VGGGVAAGSSVGSTVAAAHQVGDLVVVSLDPWDSS